MAAGHPTAVRPLKPNRPQRHDRINKPLAIAANDTVLDGGADGGP